MSILEDEREYIEALPEIEAELISEDLSSAKQHMRLLTEMERLGLMEALMAKQDQVEALFEAELALRSDERWQRQVQERYEPQLRQIDKDLERMSRTYIFVAADDGYEACDDNDDQ